MEDDSEKMDAIQRIINKSGNGFHVQAADMFRGLGWEVQVSPYYNDNITEKSRELDIVAEKSYQYSSFGQTGHIVIRLYVECKYVPKQSSTVFWFMDKNVEQASLLVEKSGIRAPSENVYSEQHHYYTDRRVAKLFESANKEFLQTALSQCLNGAIYFREDGMLRPIGGSSPVAVVHYPIILTNTLEHFYAVGRGGEHAPIIKPFQLEVDYAYKSSHGLSVKEYFLIDIVGLPQLKGFLESLEKQDVDIIAKQSGVNVILARNMNEARYS